MSNNDKRAMAKGKPVSKMKKFGKIALIVLLWTLAFLLLLVGAGFFALDYFIDDTLDYISYVSDGEDDWSGVDIDSPEYYDEVEDDLGIDFSNFVDPEASDDAIDDYTPNSDNSGGSSGNSGGNSGGSYEIPVYEPDYEIIEGLFDGDTVTEEYDKDVINILLIGDDTRSGSHARSDTMILMSINNVKKRITFTSFMRDCYLSIPGYRDNRLNAAYAAGGPSLLIKTIKQNFDIDIDHYFTVNFSAFQQAVDIIGGLDITVNDVNYNYFNTFSEISGLTEEQATDGTRVIHLSGYQALSYARNRKYKDGDFTRTLHQRDLLTQFVNNCRGQSLSQLHDLLKAVLPYVVTNMPKSNLKSMIWDITTYLSYSVTDARVPCAGSFKFETIRGMSVMTINLSTNQKYLKAKIYG